MHRFRNTFSIGSGSKPGPQQSIWPTWWTTYTIGEPEEPAVKPVITEWLRQRKIGERLRNAGCDGAYELWSVCATA